jgi:hypothetical protein
MGDLESERLEYIKLESRNYLPAAYPNDKDFPIATLSVQKDTLIALELPSILHPELKEYLGISEVLGLFRAMPPEKMPRTVECVPSRDKLGYQPVLNFQDGVSRSIYI